MVERRVGDRAATPARSRRSRIWPSTPTAAASCLPASRAASTPRRSTATEFRRSSGPASSTISTSSATFRAPNSAEYGFMPQSDCFSVALALSLPVVAQRHVEGDRVGGARQRQVAPHGDAPAVRLDGGRAELDRLAVQHLVVDRLADVVLVAVVERLHAAGALHHAQRAGVGRERHARVLAELERGLPGGHLEHEIVPGLGGRSAPRGLHRQRAVGRSERVRALERHRAEPILRVPKVRPRRACIWR